MRRRILIGILALGAGWYGVEVLKGWSLTTPFLTSGAIVSEPTRALESQDHAPTRPSEAARAAVESPVSVDDTDPTRSVRKALAEIDFKNLLNDRQVARTLAELVEKSESTPPAEPELQSFHERWREACRDLGSENRRREVGEISPLEWREATHLCLVNSMAYQTLGRGLELSKRPRAVGSSAELKPKEYAELVFFYYQTGRWAEAESTASEWLRVQPDSLPAQRVRLASLVQVIASGAITEKAEPALWKKAEVSLAAVKRLLAKSPESRTAEEELVRSELYLTYLRRLNANDLGAKARATLLEDPRSVPGHEFLAIAEFEMGHKQEALQWWKKRLALRAHPEGEATLARLQRGEERPFRLALTNETTLLELAPNEISSE